MRDPHALDTRSLIACPICQDGTPMVPNKEERGAFIGRYACVKVQWHMVQLCDLPSGMEAYEPVSASVRM